MKTAKETAKETIKRIMESPLSLREKRDFFASESYSSAFPTSPEAIRAKEYRLYLNIFDIEHPEVIAEINAEIEAKRISDAEKVKNIGWI